MDNWSEKRMRFCEAGTHFSRLSSNAVEDTGAQEAPVVSCYSALDVASDADDG